MTAVVVGTAPLSRTTLQSALRSAQKMSFEMSDRRTSSANEGLRMSTAIILRRLPLTTTPDALKTMLLFAKDLQDIEIISTDHEEDKGFATAIARFSSLTGASEAQTMLDGKINATGHAHMIVELLPSPVFSTIYRRNTIDPSISRGIPQTSSPLGRPPRFTVPFSPVDKLSSPPGPSPPDMSHIDGANNFPGMFQAQSPRNHAVHDRTRITGKSVISEDDGGDDETDGILSDPVGYMRKDNIAGIPTARRSHGPRLPMQNFSALSLNTNMMSPTQGNFGTPRSAMSTHTPHAPFSPGGNQYSSGANQYLRHNYPPVNPADQNPPCNTLYVGNLPMDTSEDELKAMFSKQRGYKRLCFRTKQNGPMCFVEFEDVSFATKALNELYGAQLHNSIKGGIRLSFSKNPLGVRSGQPGSNTNPSTPLSVNGPGSLNGLSAMSPGGFSTASGPPPGLSAPPGFPPSNNGIGPYGNLGLGVRSAQAGSDPGTFGATYPDYMLGR